MKHLFVGVALAAMATTANAQEPKIGGPQTVAGAEYERSYWGDLQVHTHTKNQALRNA